MRCSLVSSDPGVRFGFKKPAWLAAALFALASALSQPALANPDALHEGRQWTHQAQLKNQAREALETLRAASQHGLPESRYALTRLNLLANNLQSLSLIHI